MKKEFQWLDVPSAQSRQASHLLVATWLSVVQRGGGDGGVMPGT